MSAEALVLAGARAGRRRVLRRRFLRRPAAVASLIVIVVFRGFTAEHRCYIHLVQALLFAVPVAGNFVHLHRDRRR